MQGEQEREGAGPDRLAKLKDRVDELGRMQLQFQEARSAGRRTRIGIVIVIILVFIGYGVAWYRTWHRFDQDRFLVQLGVDAKDILDQMRNELNPAVKRLRPVYELELQKQLKDEWPEIQRNLAGQMRTSLSSVAAAYSDEFQLQLGNRWPEMRDELTKQGELFIDNIDDMAEARLRTKLNEIAARQEQRVVSVFPVLADPVKRDIVMDNLQKALQGAVLDVLQERIANAEVALLRVHERVLAFLPEASREDFAERMAKVWEQVLLYDLEGVKEIEP